MVEPRDETGRGKVVILNGAPRSGKSSIALALGAATGEGWRNLGVDWSRTMTPYDLQPGIGLRPGGERPDLEAAVWDNYDQLYSVVAATAERGINVAVDVGHHRSYAEPLDPWRIARTHLSQTPTWVIGVRCAVAVVAQRRAEAEAGYASFEPDGAIAEPVHRWEAAVHHPGIYDLEVDTTTDSAQLCANVIAAHLASGAPGTALGRAAG